MGKIIKFPSGEDITTKEKRLENKYKAISDELVTTSQYLFDVIEEFILTGQASEIQDLQEMNIRDEVFQESRDMYVLINILNSTLNRFMGMPHLLHREMDKLYIKLKKAQDGYFIVDTDEIIFSPDFDINIPLDKDEGGLNEDEPDDTD